MELPTHTPVASGPTFPNPIWWMQRDFTRKYHAQIFQQELAFRDRLYHVYASSSRKELLQQEFGKTPNQIMQQEYSKNLQQNSSTSPDSVLPKQPGWCSPCEVDSKTEEVLEKHNFIDKQVLMSKELKEGSDNGREENLEQQKTQTEQQRQERDINDDLQKQEKSMKNDVIPSNECKRLPNSNQLTTEECVICNKLFNCQDDFKSHLAGRKHVKQLLQRITCVKALSEVKDDSKKCENAVENKMISSDSGLLAKDNVEKRLEKELVQKVKDNGDLVARENKVGIRENAELNEQQQIMVEGMPSKLCKRSLNSSELSIKKCKISYVEGDEQKSAENKLVWKVKDDRDLGAKINEVDMKENAELIDQHQMKEGNSKQQKVQIEKQMTEGNSKQQKVQIEQHITEGNSKQQKPQIEKQMTEGNSKQQKVQIEQHMTEGNSKQQKPQMEQQMMEGEILSKEHEKSLNSNQLKTKECVICNIVFKYQVDFEAHLSGRKHAKQLKKLETNLVQKVADGRDFGGQSNKVGMKETAEHELEQINTRGASSKICKVEQEMMEGGIPSKEYGGSLNSNALNIKECVICNVALRFQVDVEAHLSGRKHAQQLKKMETKLGGKVADDSDFNTKSNEVGMKETDDLELEQRNTRGAPSKLCKMLSNASQLSIEECKISKEKEARQLSIEECKISKEKDDVNKSDENKLVWKVKDDRNLDAKRNKVDMKQLETNLVQKVADGRDFGAQSNKVGMKEIAELELEQMNTRGVSSKILKMEQQMMEGGIPSKEYGGSLNSNPLKIKECVICNVALRFQVDVEAHLSGRKHAQQLKKMETKLGGKVADDSDFNTKSNKFGTKETDEHELEQRNTRGAPSKLCKMLSNASQLSIEECKISKEKDARQLSIEESMISKEKDDANKSDKNKLVWKVRDDRNLDAKRNEVDMKENSEPNKQFLMKEGNSEQQEFQSEQKMKEGKSNQQKLQIEQQMKEENSKKQKLQMKQQIMEIGLPYKQHEGLTLEQLKVNGCMICKTALNFQGNFEAELARRKHAKQWKKMENKPVWKVTDERDLCTKSNKVGMKETAELSEKQHMKGGGMPFTICKNSSYARQLSINEFKIPITKDKVDKGAINQPVWKVNGQQWMKKTNTKQQKLQTEQQLREKHN